MKNLEKVTLKSLFLPTLAFILALLAFLIGMMSSCSPRTAETVIKGNDENIHIDQNEVIEVSIPKTSELAEKVAKDVID